jgi:hypothetical protein
LDPYAIQGDSDLGGIAIALVSLSKQTEKGCGRAAFFIASLFA